VTTPEQLESTPMVFYNTDAHVGRKIAVSPANSVMKHLAYGRIILNATQPAVQFATGERETGLICLQGEAEVEVNGAVTTLGRFDAMYMPRDSALRISTKSQADIAEISADVANRYPLQVVRNADVAKDAGLKFTTGEPGCTRRLQLLLAKNIQAGRLIAGVTHSEPGNWTSWPPHEHGKMLEEIYVYIDMPRPAFGIQMVYTKTEEPEAVIVVREGDAVLLPSGYHPNVAVPGHPIAFLWAMAAHREVEDRQYGVVNVQPEFDQGLTGLEAGRKK
jgi:5-deoxy-glucuronate isomerase